MRINTNVSANEASRNLQRVNADVSSSMAKLSSGFRINKAGDDAAGLPRVMPELLDPAEDPIHVARIFAQDAALEQQRKARAGAIAHLPVAGEALIGVDANDRAAERRPDDVGDAHVGDAQLGGMRMAVEIGVNAISHDVIHIL